MESERLSSLLEGVLRGVDGPLSLQSLVGRAGGRGGYLVLIFLCLPFTTPVPLPGVSTVIGVVIAWIALAGSGDGGLQLPGWLGRRQVEERLLRRVLEASRRLVGWMEKVVHPRNSAWLETSLSRRLHGLLLAAMASLLLLPLPVPFTNSLPGYSIILVSACLMERDGRLIFVGYLVCLVATAYVVGSMIGGWALIEAAWHWATGAGRS